jgi:hypothetical protein
MSESGIIAHLHCKTCINLKRRDRLSVGLLNPQVIRVWCERCGIPVGDLPLAISMQPRCDVCGEAVSDGLPHVH